MVSMTSRSVDTFCSVSGNSDILLLVSRDRRSAENILLASDVGFWIPSDRSAKCFLNERYSALVSVCVQSTQSTQSSPANAVHCRSSAGHSLSYSLT